MRGYQGPGVRDTMTRAECFARLMLRSRSDGHARSLLEYAERASERAADHAPDQRYNTLAWLSIALLVDDVDEATLTGIGFSDADVRLAAITTPQHGENALDYAERVSAYNTREAFAVGEAMLGEPAATNATIPPETAEETRQQAIGRLREGRAKLNQERAGDLPAEGGLTDDAPTAPGLTNGLRRLQHHAEMIAAELQDMQRGPRMTRWGIAERLAFHDLIWFISISSQLTYQAAAILMETAAVTPRPATATEWETLIKTRDPDARYLDAIGTAATLLYEVSNRLQGDIPAPPSDDKSIH